VQAGEILPGGLVIEKLVGQGGMGSVYRARDAATGLPVAVKVLHGDSPELRMRFEREATVLAGLEHPNIVRYVGYGYGSRGEPWLAMEWLDGEDLAARAARGALALDEIVALARDVAAALSAAHARGVVHRDIKPANVFLDTSRRARVLDFGVARVAAASVLTRSGFMVGTAGYMAPEQIRAVRDIGPPADVFALGCVLYELLAGRPAFRADHPMALLSKVVFEPVPRVASLAEGVPPELDALVDAMLAKEPAARPADGAAVLRALSGIVASVQAPTTGRAIGHAERIVTAIVLLSFGGRGDDPESVATAPTATPEAGHAAWSEVLRAIALFRAEAVPIADVGAFISLRGSGAATDLAARGARCALAAVAATGGAAALAVGLSLDTDPGRASLPHDRAAAVLDATPAGRVAVDAVAERLLVGFDLEPTDSGALIVGERAHTDGRLLLGRRTRFVGRERDTDALAALFDECVSEPVARAVIVMGDPGIGKTRLLRELQHRLREARPDAAIWFGCADALSAGSPFSLLGEALRGVLGIAKGDDASVARARIRARVGAGDAACLGEIAGVADDHELLAARADPVVFGDRMRRAFLDFVRAEVARGPVALFLDDAHWGDAPTLAYVDAALRECRDEALFVVALGRPEMSAVFPRLWSERGVQEVRLDTLGRRSAERFVREALPDADADLVQRVVARAGGNPFFLEELVRAVAAGQVDGFPETVVATVHARLMTLDAESRRALRAASVFGERFWATGVAAVLGADEPTVRARLADLERREWIVRRASSRFPSDPDEYAFRHALVREAAHEGLAQADVRVAHGTAAAWLEAAGETDHAVLAEHFERGDDAAQASAHWLRSAKDALEGDDQAATLRACDRGDALRPTPECAGELALCRARAQHLRADHAAAAAAAVVAMDASHAGSARWCRALEVLAISGHGARPRPRVLESVGVLLSATPDDAGATTLARCLSGVAVALFYAGLHEEAGGLVARLRDLVARVDEDHVRAILHRTEAVAAAATGAALDHRLELALRARATFVAVGDHRGAATMTTALVMDFLEVGDYARARRTAEEAIDECRAMGLDMLRVVQEHNLGKILARLGDVAAGREIEARALAFLEARGASPRYVGAAYIYLAEIDLLGGHLDLALASAQRAVELSRDAAPDLTQALGVLACVLLARGDVAAALEASSHAATLLAELGGTEEGEAQVRLAHVEALLASGQADEARAAAKTARDHILGRAATIDDLDLRASFLGNIPEHRRTFEIAAALGLAPPAPLVRWDA
jgi:tetratricopeptide (TPR) repeat protein